MRIGAPLLPHERADVERATVATAAALSAQAFTELLEEGRRMSALEAAASE
jgi:hypothetical protein